MAIDRRRGTRPVCSYDGTRRGWRSITAHNVSTRMAIDLCYCSTQPGWRQMSAGLLLYPLLAQEDPHRCSEPSIDPIRFRMPPQAVPTGLEAQPAGQSQRRTLQRQIATRDDTPATENDGKRQKTTENDRERQRTTLQRRFRTTENDRKRLKTTDSDSEPHPDRLAHDTASQRWPRRGPTAQIQHSPDVTAPQHALSLL